jgi:hypothetical protein
VRPRPLLLYCKHVIDILLLLLLLLLLLPLLLSFHHLHPLALPPDIVVDATGGNAFRADPVKAGAAFFFDKSNFSHTITRLSLCVQSSK